MELGVATGGGVGYARRASRGLGNQGWKDSHDAIFHRDGALALDGSLRPCRVLSSNAGQCLFTRIAPPEHARRIAETLLGTSMFSGWGIRTIATPEARYNPMSYHNGSVWPHDNALIALGLARYG